MDARFLGKVLAYCSTRFEDRTTLILDIHGSTEDFDDRVIDLVSEIMRRPPVVASSSDFVWSEEPYFTGLSVWVGLIEIDATAGCVIFEGTWREPEIGDLDQMVGVSRRQIVRMADTIRDQHG